MSQLADALRAAKALIDAPEKWCCNGWARDAHGEVCNYNSPDAVCFCAGGALNRTIGNNIRWQRCWTILEAAMGGSIVVENDRHDHAWVMAKFDEAIAAAAERRR